LFAAVFNRNGRPVDRRALGGAGLAVDGPADAPELAFVRSTDAAAGDWRGMESLGPLWIAGRLRLDGRDGSSSDGALCLRAYEKEGDGFVDRLAGDFACVLWDGRRRRLLAVRDRLGVRALFHAEANGTLLVSDSLDWIAAYPAVDRALDPRWIADFLTVGHGLDFETTVWRGVRRVVPAHVLEASAAQVTSRRYWRLELGEPLHLPNAAAYGERFLDLMTSAVRDRLPAGRVGISMSGGLDSTTLAACAVAATGDPSRVVAECTHFERLMPDEEKHYSTLAARHLGIEIVHTPLDDAAYDPEWRTRSIDSVEPYVGALVAEPERRMSRAQAALAPVWLFGEGPDNALVFERNAYFRWLARRRDWRGLARAALGYLGAKDGWGETLRRYSGLRAPDMPDDPEPPWLAPDIAALARRDDARSPPPHPWHPRAMASFGSAIWPALFASLDDDEAQAPLVWRHPFLDLRVLGFLLAVPPVPWARRKLLLREAMRGRLPREILERKKTPLAASPFASPVASQGLPPLARDPRLAEFVDAARLPEAAAAGLLLPRLLAVHALDYWLARHPARR
jgi:asparagine synthase (glutamine-hydrolysing)